MARRERTVHERRGPAGGAGHRRQDARDAPRPRHGVTVPSRPSARLRLVPVAAGRVGGRAGRDDAAPCRRVVAVALWALSLVALACMMRTGSPGRVRGRTGRGSAIAVLALVAAGRRGIACRARAAGTRRGGAVRSERRARGRPRGDGDRQDRAPGRRVNGCSTRSPTRLVTGPVADPVRFDIAVRVQPAEVDRAGRAGCRRARSRCGAPRAPDRRATARCSRSPHPVVSR